jgi:hypothetical protein
MRARPHHTSVLSGLAWVRELLLGNGNRIRKNLGLSRRTFRRLVTTALEKKSGLHDSRRGVTTNEQVAIFLYVVRLVSPCVKLLNDFSEVQAQSHSVSFPILKYHTSTLTCVSQLLSRCTKQHGESQLLHFPCPPRYRTTLPVTQSLPTSLQTVSAQSTAHTYMLVFHQTSMTVTQT